EDADAGPAQRLGQLDPVALHHHARDGDVGAARAVVVWAGGNSQLHRHHDVRRGAGRHLYVGLHRGAGADLSRGRHVADRDRGRAAHEPDAGAHAGVNLPASAERPHLPYPAPIDAYGKGAFRFAGVSHRGSLLCLPDGIWAWPVTAPGDITEAALAGVNAAEPPIELLL